MKLETFQFLEKGLGIVFPPHFLYDFSRKMILIYIILTGQISLSDCLYFLRCHAIFVSFPGCEILKLFLSF